MDLTNRQNLLLEFIKDKHDNHSLRPTKAKRKYTGKPYWTHPLSVAKLVEKYKFGIEVALCHDLFEDTTCDDIELENKLQEFGYLKTEAVKISRHVTELIDIFTSDNFPELNRKERKQFEAERLGKISSLSQTVKYADLIDNTSEIVPHDINFSKIYLNEKKELLKGLRQGDPDLMVKCFFTLFESIEILSKLNRLTEE